MAARTRAGETGEGAPEADRLDGFPHPRERSILVGHRDAELALLTALRTGRMHHGWIIGGPPGIGKATLAYRVARYLLSGRTGAEGSLAIPADEPAFSRVAAMSHPDLAVVRRIWNPERKAFGQQIRVDDVRAATRLFTTTSGAGGWRIAIVDSADDLNASSANALLKMLEEPPSRGLFLIVAHHPARLLPTIRSRCRLLPLRPLDDREVEQVTQGFDAELGGRPAQAHEAAARRAEGSVRRALSLLQEDGVGLRGNVEQLLAGLPRLERDDVRRLAERLAGKAGREEFEVFRETLEDHLSQKLRASSAQRPARLAAISALWEKLGRQSQEIETYNLDRRPFVLSFLAELAEMHRRIG